MKAVCKNWRLGTTCWGPLPKPEEVRAELPKTEEVRAMLPKLEEVRVLLPKLEEVRANNAFIAKIGGSA